ncbi:MAG: hypothetical protein ACRCYS_13480, partial [Beijerinckiaceae bacterium]
KTRRLTMRLPFRKKVGQAKSVSWINVTPDQKGLGRTLLAYGAFVRLRASHHHCSSACCEFGQ